MSNLGMVLSIAKDALAAQTYGIDVTAHNIANVSTEGYSRQTPVYESKEPAPYGGVLLGRGVETSQVLRTSDQFIENQLMRQKSSMFSSQEMENYMRVLEGQFTENTENSISGLIADFWAKWQDISNDPSGSSARVALYEHAVLLADQFNTLDSDLSQLETDLTNAISSGITKINEIASEIARINDQIVGTEIGNIANDLRDKRNVLVSEFSEYMDVKTFEQGNGALTVIIAKGCAVVHGNSSYDLAISGDNVLWEGSGDSTVDITNHISTGSLGGWLDMRDEVIAKYKLDLDALAKEFVWAVNEQHSQGVGLEFFSSDVTGTYKTGSSGLLSTLTYGQGIDYTKDFKMWIKDSSVPPATFSAATVDMGISTSSVNWGAGVNPDTASYAYTFTVTTGGTVGTGTQVIDWSNSDGDSGTINNITATGNYTVHGGMEIVIGAGTLVAGNTLTINTEAAGAPKPLDIDLSASGPANSLLDTYTFTVTTGGTIGADTPVVSWSNSVTSGTINITAAGDYTVDGMTLNFASGTLAVGDAFTITTDSSGTPTANLPSEWHWTLESFKDEFNAQATGVSATVTSDNALKFSPAANYSFAFCDDTFSDCGLLSALGINTFFEGSGAGGMGINSQLANKDYMAAGQIDADTGDLATGNNTNALAISSVQYTTTEIKQWTCDRLSGNTQGTVNATIEGYYHSMVGSIGIKSSSISRSNAFNEVMVHKLGEIRDSISAVSLDEEMTNLIKFQHAYAAAAKLISVSDEMLSTLLNVK